MRFRPVSQSYQWVKSVSLGKLESLLPPSLICRGAIYSLLYYISITSGNRMINSDLSVPQTIYTKSLMIASHGVQTKCPHISESSGSFSQVQRLFGNYFA